MAKNITLKLKEDLLRETRALAAEEDKSISGWVTGLIESEIEKRRGFLKVKKHAIRTIQKGVSLKRKSISRAELYE